jgi:glycosyltransferase involved in cell wall biosynthesis
MGPSVTRDVAIYMPQAVSVYEGSRGTGGAERQTYLLARALADAGCEVAHVVFALQHGPPPSHAHLSVLQRPARARVPTAEARRIWRALAVANAQTYVVRTATPALGIAGLFCRRHQRRLVFSTANDGDFTLETIASRSARLYKLGVALADLVVVQSAQQADLAAGAFPAIKRLVEIPSFFESNGRVAAQEPDAFLWIGRLVDYKQPLKYLDLAAAVPEARFRMIQSPHDAPLGVAEAVRRRAAELPNLELLDPRPHDAAMELLERAVALISTSRSEGMPNVFLESWALGLPVISLDYDPDGRIAAQGLGIAAKGSWERFVTAVREMWHRRRTDRGAYAGAAHDYLERVHGSEAVASLWRQSISSLQ